MRIDKYDVIQIDKNSWRIEDDIVRAFLFRGSKGALLVDSTNGSGNLKAVVESLIDTCPVMLVNTHADADHIGCNEQFEEAYMHPAEFAYYAAKCKDEDAIPKPLLDGDKIDIGGRCFEVILVPGHTSGSIVLLDRENRILIGGDTILNRVFIFGQTRNLKAIIASLKRICENYWNAFDIVYSSHYEFEVDKTFILKELECAEAHLERKIVGEDPGPIPLEPPDFRPAKMYELNGAAFYDYAEE